MCYQIDDRSSTRSSSPVPGKVLATWQLDCCEWNPPNSCHIQLLLSTISYTASPLCISLSSIDKELVAEISRWFSLLLFLLAPKMLESTSRLWNGIFSSIFHFYFQSNLSISDFQIRLCMWFIYFINTLVKRFLPSASACDPQSFLKAQNLRVPLTSSCYQIVVYIQRDDNFKK